MSQAAPPPAAGHKRWIVCALLLFAATINYIDRQVISILKQPLSEAFGWTDERIYSSIIFSFSLAYAIGFIFAGRIIDRIGVRAGFAISVALWSCAAVGHGFVTLFPGLHLSMVYLDATAKAFVLVPLTGAAAGFALARFALGIGESGAFPSSIKSVAEWFPRKERALATGIFNAGTNVGALVTPLAVPAIIAMASWRWAFVITGGLGFAWVVCWLLFYREPGRHPTVTAAELAYIRSDPAEQPERVPWLPLLGHRQTWAFAIGKFLTDPIWWMYLYWVPDFLGKTYNVTITISRIGPPLVAIYLFADVGSVGGGWLSSYFLRKGWTPNRARKTAMLICALCVVPVMFASRVRNEWTAVAIISLAAAAHQGWSANIFTLVSDMFPGKAVGSVVGIGGTAGAIGGMFIALFVGAVLQKTNNNYTLIFLVASFTYLVALAIIHLLAPRLTPVESEPAIQ